VTKAAEPAPSPSLAALNKLADRLHETEATLTKEQCFAKVYSDPRNRELVRKERAENRPRLTVEVEKDGARSVIGQRVMRLAAALGQQHPRMTHDECVDAVLRANPDLRRAWEQEQEQAA
jgi:outer membrane protein TolC